MTAGGKLHFVTTKQNQAHCSKAPKELKEGRPGAQVCAMVMVWQAASTLRTSVGIVWATEFLEEMKTFFKVT